MDALALQRDKLDLVYSIKGMYRILDLISEQGSGGLGEYHSQIGAFVLIIDLVSVDKIIISQNSLKAFMNDVCQGAYISMTKVNFKTLDNYVIKPVGVYGSKEEIVRFLLQLAAIDETMYVIPLGPPFVKYRCSALTVRNSFALIPMHMCTCNRPSVQACTS